MTRWSLTGSKPDWLSTEDQRYIVATNEGWVFEKRYTNTMGNTKVHRELLVSIDGLSNSSNMGAPTITDVFLANSAGGNVIRKNDVSYAVVLFDEPIAGSPVGWTLTVANTASGNNITAHANTGTTYTYANNSLVFMFSTANTGTYKIQGQSLANSNDLVKSINPGLESVSRLISDAVSNALGSFSIVA